MKASEELHYLLADMKAALGLILACNKKIKELERRALLPDYPQNKSAIENNIMTNIKLRETQIKKYNKLLITFKEFYSEPLN